MAKSDTESINATKKAGKSFAKKCSYPEGYMPDILSKEAVEKLERDRLSGMT